MSHSAVLFDLDGTLLNTIDDLTDAINAALAKSGLPARSVAECRYFVGDGVQQLVLRSLPEGRRDAATAAAITEAYRAAYAANWDRKTTVYEGIPELLDGLTARAVAMAVFSNKPDDFTRLMVARLLPRWPFAAVRGARGDRPRKPDPAVALEIARDIGVCPADFLYVGDTDTDMQTAAAAGMYAVGALWGFRTADELLRNGARTLIAHPSELLRLV